MIRILVRYQEEAMAEVQKSKTITILIPLVTALIGLSAGHLFTISQQKQKSVMESRIEAYAQFFSGQAKLRTHYDLLAIGKKDEADKILTDYQLQVREAKFKIGIYGSKPVIKAMADFFKKYGINQRSNDKEKWNNDIQIYQQMRNEVFRNDYDQIVDNKDLLILMFSILLE